MNKYLDDFQLKQRYNSNINNLEIVVLGTIEYQWLLKPLAFMFWKYFQNAKILYFSNKFVDLEHVPANVELRTLPFDNWDWFSDFGEGLRQAVLTLKGKVFFLCLLDMWPNNYIKLDRVEMLYNYLNCNSGTVLRGLVGDDSNLLAYGHSISKKNELDIITTTKYDKHSSGNAGFMLTPSLWNKELLLKYLENCSIWDIEEHHTRKMRKDSVYSVWTRQSIFPFYHTLTRESKGTKIFLKRFFDEDKKILESFIPKSVSVIK